MTPQRANVVLAIVAVFLTLGLCLPTRNLIHEGARRADATMRMGNFLQGILSYHDEFKHLPPVFDGHHSQPGDAHRVSPVSYPVSLHVHVMPFVDAEQVYQGYLKEGNGDAEATVSAYHVAIDHSPGKRDGSQGFAANLRIFCWKGFQTALNKDVVGLARVEPGKIGLSSIMRGTSNTIAVSTKFAKCGEGGSRYAADPTSPWAAFFGEHAAQVSAAPFDPRATFQWSPSAGQCLTSPLMPQSSMRQGLLMGMADGVVRLMPPEYDPGLWNRLINSQEW